jgi:hypothetical protein
MRSILSAICACFLVVAPVTAAAELSLLMVEEEGCMWCAQWNKEISQIYHKTPEGQIAPLRRMSIRHDVPADISLKRSLHYTPTFVLIENGNEIGRIEGYPGEDFFWGLLGVLLRDAGISLDRSG